MWPAGHRLLLALALFVFEALQQGSHLGDFLAEHHHARLAIAQRTFYVFQMSHHVAQFALERKRSLAALLAAGHGHVVEALAALREEECVGIFQRQFAADGWIGNDVAVAKLRQHHFQRLAEAVEHADAVLHRRYAIRREWQPHRLVEHE